MAETTDSLNGSEATDDTTVTTEPLDDNDNAEVVIQDDQTIFTNPTLADVSFISSFRFHRDSEDTVNVLDGMENEGPSVPSPSQQTQDVLDRALRKRKRPIDDSTIQDLLTNELLERKRAPYENPRDEASYQMIMEGVVKDLTIMSHFCEQVESKQEL